MKFLSTFALLLLLGSINFAQTAVAPKDVWGWEGANWAMRAKRIQKVFAETKDKRTFNVECKKSPLITPKNVDHDECLFRFPGIPFGDKSTAILYVSKKLGLYRIRLFGRVEPESKPNIPLFEETEKTLIEQYGPVNGNKVGSDASPYIFRKREWNFPSTLIRLHYSFSGGNFSFLTVDYFPLAFKSFKQGRRVKESAK